MANVPTGPAQILARFGDQSVACSQYALSKLGVDRSHCFLKIDEYIILCVPFQLGFKRSLFLASLSKQELTFFQRYVNGIVGLSISFFPPNRQEPIKLYVRCNLATIGQMKGRENVGLFVVDFKNTPDDYVTLLGNYLDSQERLRVLYDDYGKTGIRMTPEVAKLIGYNMYATITEPSSGAKRIQVYSFSTKVLEHLEAGSGTERPPGTSVAYQLFFRKYRISAAGTVESTTMLPKGIVRTVSKLAFSPELVEIVDDYWYNTRSNPGAVSM
ncbi:PilZN3 domain-containing protein [Breznakiella homolactica]|uniref:PilZN3 domain-containing protein n=1 Tax=Breznakiella homolactica TaxID=2798577 RepID=A0A7T8B7Y2_9SPIR|nr:PilZN3 domain-containing protein [Breznakiella homolactica]QQO08014.1 hypothetical protein JFL75_13810 [Breznakiella homolactica]